MFQLLCLLISSTKTGYCIYNLDSQETTCTEIIKTFDKSLSPSPVKKDAIETTFASGISGDSIVVFLEDMEITSAQLLAMKDSTNNKLLPMFFHGCKVSVTVDKAQSFPKIPLGFKYQGDAILFTPAATDKIQKSDLIHVGHPIKLNGAMTYIINDNVESSLPTKNFDINGQTITYECQNNNLERTRLIISTEGVKWGKTTISTTAIKVPDNSIVHYESKPTEKVAITGKCYFDSSFTDIAECVSNAGTYYVLDENAHAFVSGGSATKYVAYCLSSDSKQKCPTLGISNPTAGEGNQAGIDATSIVAFAGEVTLLAESLALKAVVVTEDATKITIQLSGTNVPPSSLDVRKPIFVFELKPTPAHLLVGATVTFSGEVNAKSVPAQAIENFPITAAGFAVTPVTGSFTMPGTVTVASKIITPYAEDSKVDFRDGKVIIDGVEIATTEVIINSLPEQKLTVSQNGVKDTMKIVLTAGEIEFDSTWNSVSGNFVTATAPTVTANYAGTPPWLSAGSASSGTVKINTTPAPTPKPEGLPSWGIALIVIACVIVVAVIVVVVLNVTGVIHLCGKKKVEV